MLTQFDSAVKSSQTAHKKLTALGAVSGAQSRAPVCNVLRSLARQTAAPVPSNPQAPHPCLRS